MKWQISLGRGCKVEGEVQNYIIVCISSSLYHETECHAIILTILNTYNTECLVSMICVLAMKLHY